MKPNYEAPIDSSADLVTRNIRPYVHPGGFVWKDVLKNSPIKANQELSSRLVIPEDWDDWEALTRKTLEKGTYAKLGNEITDREKSMGVWYQSKTTPWSTKYSGYVRDAFYKKNLLRRIHRFYGERGQNLFVTYLMECSMLTFVVLFP